MSNPDDPQTWMSFARMDLLCIDNNLTASEVPWRPVAFPAQQAAEKALKAVLVHARADVPRTHDLNRLLNDCLRAGAPFDGLVHDCALLTPHAVVIRYPGEELPIDHEEAMAAVEAGRRVYDSVQQFLSSRT